MRAAWKLSMFLILLLVVYLSFGLIMHAQLSHIANLVDKIYNHPLPTIREALFTDQDIIVVDRNIKDILLTKDPELRRSLLADIDLYQGRMVSHLNSLFDSIMLERGRILTHQAQALANEREAVTKKFAAAIMANDEKLAAQIELKEGQRVTNKIEEAMGILIGYAAGKGSQFQKESKESLKRSQLILFSCGIVILILSVVFASVIGRWFLASLYRSRKTIESLQKTPIDLTVRLEPAATFSINASLNLLLKNLKGEMSQLKSSIDNVGNELTKSHTFLEEQNSAISEILPQFEETINAATTMTTNYIQEDKRLLVFTNLFNRLRGELILLSKLSSGCHLIVDQLKHPEINQGEDRQLLDNLERYQCLIKNEAVHCMQSIEEISKTICALEEQIHEFSIRSPQEIHSEDIPTSKLEAALDDLKIKLGSAYK